MIHGEHGAGSVWFYWPSSQSAEQRRKEMKQRRRKTQGGMWIESLLLCLGVLILWYLFKPAVCACVCGAISYVNIDDLPILCALFQSIVMCLDSCFCSCLWGVLEGSLGLYIQTQHAEVLALWAHRRLPFLPPGEISHIRRAATQKNGPCISEI